MGAQAICVEKKKNQNMGEPILDGHLSENNLVFTQFWLAGDVPHKSYNGVSPNLKERKKRRKDDTGQQKKHRLVTTDYDTLVESRQGS